MKKKVIPIVAGVILLIAIVAFCSGSNKIQLVWEPVAFSSNDIDSVELKVYVENSGSMDAYMCPGSNLKDAVFDYVSDLTRNTSTFSLNYINSEIIPYKGDLQSFIKNLTPSSFAKAGGDRSNTDLMKIFSLIMAEQTDSSVTVFVSDCILDIPENAQDFFGHCQVSIKNTFNDALSKFPNLGVQIYKMNSKFSGYWYCGKNSKEFTDIVRPYYIWVMGDAKVLSRLNAEVPVNGIYGGIDSYCAYSPKHNILFDIDKSTYVVNHSGCISVQILADLQESLQSDDIICDCGQYKVTESSISEVSSVNKISVQNSKYSHVITVDISNPKTVKDEVISFSYPYIASWVENSNDDTGQIDENNIDKTTGILPLVKGVAEAYKDHLEYGNIKFSLKNK